jgi:hypothetical protein
MKSMIASIAVAGALLGAGPAFAGTPRLRARRRISLSASTSWSPR